MLRLPLSFTGVFVAPAVVAAGGVVLVDVDAPTHAAAIGIAAAAAAPLRTVRRFIFRWVTSSTLLTSRARIPRDYAPAADRRNAGSTLRERSLRAPRLRLVGIEPQAGDRLGDVGRAVLLVERDAVPGT